MLLQLTILDDYLSHQYRNKSISQLTSPTTAELPGSCCGIIGTHSMLRGPGWHELTQRSDCLKARATKMMFWALARVSFSAAKIVSCN
jgi:hypothetical protein